jgi:hypothetical protein
MLRVICIGPGAPFEVSAGGLPARGRWPSGVGGVEVGPRPDDLVDAIEQRRVEDGVVAEEIHARLVATKAALQALDELANQGLDLPGDRRAATPLLRLPADPPSRVRAQREGLLRMRSEGEPSNDAINRILRELDREGSRLEI